MTSIKLIHPTLGVCADTVVTRQNSAGSKDAIIKKWKYTYGKKFYECKVELGTPTHKRGRKVVDLTTRVVYVSAELAARTYNISRNQVYMDCNKNRVANKVPFRFEWVTA